MSQSGIKEIYWNNHWRRSAPNSAGALQGRGGEFRGNFTPFYTIKFRGGCKRGGARAPAAPPSSAPMGIILYYYRPLYLPIGIMNLQNILCLKTIIAFPTDLINSENCYKIFQFECDSNLYYRQ